MSYAVRNTIILVIILVLLVASGYLWLHFKFSDNTSNLLLQVDRKEQTLSQMETVIADYEYYQGQLDQTTIKLEHYPKLIPPEKSIQETYRYLDKISTRSASFVYDFRLLGVEQKQDAVQASFQLKGEGKFSNIANFIYRLENGKPIYIIETLSFNKQKTKGREQSDLVDVSMKIVGLFNKQETSDDTWTTDIFQQTFIFPGMQLKIQTDSAKQTSLDYHIVEPGESLKRIAGHYYGDEERWREIYELNLESIENPNIIYPGQSLKIINTIVEQTYIMHEVQPGESLGSIAEQYLGDRKRWREIYEENVSIVENPNYIFPGQTLNIVKTIAGTSELIHTIGSGETLSSLAELYFGEKERWLEIYQLNQDVIGNPNAIYAGQQLKIVNATGGIAYVFHEVQSGETLRSLAEHYLGDENRWREIYEWNQDKIDDLIPDEILSRYDPFGPLILEALPPNLEGFLDVNRAKLVALRHETAFIQDQKGVMKELNVGDKVYLGYLSTIDLNKGSVTFNMDKGGIFETVTLNLMTIQEGRK